MNKTKISTNKFCAQNWRKGIGAKKKIIKKNKVDERIFVVIISKIICNHFRATDNIIGHDGSISNSLARLNDDGSCYVGRFTTQR